ncbi:MerR family transcriptional regulator [Fructilactobacillus lindneri]|uniref:HTH-type transcriptional regulator glnR n=2 Tax=Fructilactobacillus lindneri TaxID=53444 RepID=A0A0R2JXS9_9LACO|nr:MerR family transcriptional regulator [Fructilactobacillus lindneri]ANZ57318.1 MerR family transcriptional regulator [Fructilactobacillus lindneri]ANZ58583.1 MerR family transcriptional regulator [Fructilactobacillus lindneri]KRN79354.1 HTH-type transcriptional regulator glnR [Fructilactobacillus lindneri DSM 20690 = JCM 11027]POG98376.1 MerR family transcriptional regulator [Fructilactobacillus lindneri]POH03775.1 MerR family transcriptional regulator [Fructilactobacillus lindneri]
MSEKELRRSLAVLPMGPVMKLTSLTARQIRYYDDHGLVNSKRTDSNRRLYSLNDIDRILEVKDYLNEGMNIEQVKRVYEKQQRRLEKKQNLYKKTISDGRVREYLRDDILKAGGLYPDDDSQFKQGHL